MDTTSQTARQPASPAEAIITPQAMRLVTELQRRFNPRRLELLAARGRRQAAIDAGAMPDFLPETAAIRAADWRIAPVPADLQDRRAEITGPVERKMMINALNSAALAFMVAASILVTSLILFRFIRPEARHVPEHSTH